MAPSPPNPIPCPCLVLTCSELSLHPVQLSFKNIECYQIRVIAENRRRHLAGKWKCERYGGTEHRQALQETELSFNHCNDTLSRHTGRVEQSENRDQL